MSKTEAAWEIPAAKPLVIGILPVFGKDLGLGTGQLMARLAVKIRQTDEWLKAADKLHELHVIEPGESVAKITFKDLRF